MYSFVISEMTWSFSRISCYNTCPYQFFLTYIQPQEQEPSFYAQFGSFIHDLLARFYQGTLPGDHLTSDYIQMFPVRVSASPPSAEIRARYFLQGLSFLRTVQPLKEEILGVEQFAQFSVGGFPFVGYMDLVTRSPDGLIITDHKSRSLKPRSARQKSTKSDILLDQYLRQLYLYSIFVQQQYGVLPSFLRFNCYRDQVLLQEKFSANALEEAKQWAVSSIHRIINASSFPPNPDFFYCRHLCPVRSACAYSTLSLT